MYLKGKNYLQTPASISTSLRSVGTFRFNFPSSISCIFDFSASMMSHHNQQSVCLSIGKDSLWKTNFRYILFLASPFERQIESIALQLISKYTHIHNSFASFFSLASSISIFSTIRNNQTKPTDAKEKSDISPSAQLASNRNDGNCPQVDRRYL